MHLLSNQRATPTTRAIRIALDGAPFSFRAGQAAWLGVDANEDNLTPYSIASSPEECARLGALEFLIKVDGSSRFGSRVASLRRGTPLVLRGPVGAFTFPDNPAERHFLFVAGGTGIAPLRAMIRHAIDVEVPGSVRLLYSARTADEFAYLKEFRLLARDRQIALGLTLTGPVSTWRHARGRISTELLRPVIDDPATLCFVCGPPAMVSEVPAALITLGVERDRIRTEGW